MMKPRSCSWQQKKADFMVKTLKTSDKNYDDKKIQKCVLRTSSRPHQRVKNLKRFEASTGLPHTGISLLAVYDESYSLGNSFMCIKNRFFLTDLSGFVVAMSSVINVCVGE